jgi:hypothetical protein
VYDALLPVSEAPGRSSLLTAAEVYKGRAASGTGRLELKAAQLTKCHVERHHNGESAHEQHGGEVGVPTFLRLWYQLLDDEDHGSGGKGRRIELLV